MSKLAGMFYFDFRPLTTADEVQVYSALKEPEQLRGPEQLRDPEQLSVRIYRSHGLLMGHAASVSDAGPENDCCMSSNGTICTWDGRLDNSEDLLTQRRFDSLPFGSGSHFALQA